MSLEYIRDYYDVPAHKSARILYGDKPGEIQGADGQYLRIKLDGEDVCHSYHPTWNITYLKQGEEGFCEFCGGFGRKDTDKAIQYCCKKAFYAYQ